MRKSDYYQKLLKYKDNKMPFYLFLGGKWMFLKILIIGLGISLINLDENNSKIFGGMAIGYVLGKTMMGIALFKTYSKTWIYMRDIVNWNQVSEIINEEKK